MTLENGGLTSVLDLWTHVKRRTFSLIFTPHLLMVVWGVGRVKVRFGWVGFLPSTTQNILGEHIWSWKCFEDPWNLVWLWMAYFNQGTAAAYPWMDQGKKHVFLRRRPQNLQIPHNLLFLISCQNHNCLPQNHRTFWLTVKGDRTSQFILSQKHILRTQLKNLK